MKALSAIASGLLWGVMLGFGIFCMLMPEDASASDAPSYPVLILVHEQRGCPAGQFRAIYLRDPKAQHEFCWHSTGSLILITAGKRIVTRVPASHFRPVDDPLDIAISTKSPTTTRAGASQ